jgi:hypothetical protein
MPGQLLDIGRQAVLFLILAHAFALLLPLMFLTRQARAAAPAGHYEAATCWPFVMTIASRRLVRIL